MITYKWFTHSYSNVDNSIRISFTVRKFDNNVELTHCIESAIISKNNLSLFPITTTTHVSEMYDIEMVDTPEECRAVVQSVCGQEFVNFVEGEL